jgi:hypothetical protein
MGITQDSNNKIIGSSVEESAIGIGIHDTKPEGYVDIGDSSVYSPIVIQARSAPPSSPVLGSIYLDDGTNTGGTRAWRFYTGEVWSTIGGSGGGGFDPTAVSSITWSDGSHASVTHTFAVTGTDPVWAYSNGVVNLSSGTLQVGGSAVMVNPATPGANVLWGFDSTDGTWQKLTIGTNLSYSHSTHTLSAAGGSPGGSDTQVQFNDGGSTFGGDSGLTYNKTTKALTTTTFVGALTGTASGNLTSGGALGTPASGNLTSCTSLPITTGVSGLGSNVATFLATPSSSNLASAVTDETGSGALVFGTAPTLASPIVTGSMGVGTTTPIGTEQVVIATASPFIVGGATVGSYTSCTFPTANKDYVNKTGIGTASTVGDLVVVTGGTGAYTGMYSVLAIVNANSIQLSRVCHASGSDIVDGTVSISTTPRLAVGTNRTYINSSLVNATSNEVAVKLDYTVNKATSGNDAGLQINMTDTASPGVSKPLQINVGATEKASIDNTGALALGLNTAITGESKHLRVTISNPNATYNNSRYVPLIPALDSAITVTAINVTTDSASYEVTGNLVWADAFISKANQATVAAFTTTSGVLASTGLTAAVASGKALYLDFTASPNSALLSACVDITYRY